MEIEQASPEYQSELDSMSIADLEAKVSQEEGAAPPAQVEATAQTQGESVGSVEQKEAPNADAEPAWFTKYKEDNKRELGSLRSLASLRDQIPQIIQKEVNQRLASLQQAQTNANLSPEDQQAQAQLQAQQQEWAKFVREQAKAEFGEAAKDYIPLLQELQEQRQQQGLQNNTFELVKEFIPENPRDVWEKVFEGVAKDIEAGKPGAVERFDKLSNSPEAIALAMVQLQRGQVTQQANKVTQQRTDQARQAAQGVKTSAVQAGGKKAVTEMSQAELDSMSVEELEAAIPKL
jgi:hypothetical protein